MTAAVRSDILDDAGWEAAQIISGDLSPQDASPAAVLLAARATDASERDVMDDIIEYQQAGYTPSGKSGPRVSDYGACARRVWYRETPPDGFVPVPVTIYDRHAALGTIIHAAGAVARAARYPWRRYEYTIPIPGLARPGRIDEYDPILGEVVDDKTAGARKWEWIGADGPTAESWGQGFIYGLALDAMGLPVRIITIIVINRDHGQEEHHSRPFDPVTAQAYLDELLSIAMALDFGVEPERERRGPNVDFECRVCPAQGACWNIAAAKKAGRSPESWTLLGETFDDLSVEWAGQHLIDLAKTRLAAKVDEDAAKALIQGVPPGLYGNVRIVEDSHTYTDYRVPYERIRDMYMTLHEMEALPPTAPHPNDLIRPRPSRSKTTTAKPMRQADIKAREKAAKAKAAEGAPA